MKKRWLKQRRSGPFVAGLAVTGPTDIVIRLNSNFLSFSTFLLFLKKKTQLFDQKIK
jgi:hypothetical protein